MRGRTYRTDAIALISLLVVYFLLSGCIRSSYYEHHPVCPPDAPCRGHEGQTYCTDDATWTWTCCRCRCPL